MSFRVRLARITYRDNSGQSDDTTTRYGFLIEDVDDLAKRLDLEEINITQTHRSTLDPAQGARVSLFEYLIGNLDWSMNYGADGQNCCHNGKLLRAENGEGPFFPVAYDFDFSGFVDASYARPPDGLRVRNVRQRLYRGYCAFNAEIPTAIAAFNDARPQITALLNETTSMTDTSRNRALSYIDGFYNTINDAEDLQDDIYDKCMG
jgi:hypothetical protein